MESIHLNEAIEELQKKETCTLSVVTLSGSLYRYVGKLHSVHFRGRSLRMKLEHSGEIREVKTCGIIAINGKEVYR